MVTLVWLAPAEPAPVRFFVQVMAMDAGAPREVVGRYVDVSSVQVPLATAETYAWRVLTVALADRHYAAGAWQRFQTTQEFRRSP
jgi:hypothetical protein